MNKYPKYIRDRFGAYKDQLYKLIYSGFINGSDFDEYESNFEEGVVILDVGKDDLISDLESAKKVIDHIIWDLKAIEYKPGDVELRFPSKENREEN